MKDKKASKQANKHASKQANKYASKRYKSLNPEFKEVL